MSMRASRRWSRLGAELTAPPSTNELHACGFVAPPNQFTHACNASMSWRHERLLALMTLANPERQRLLFQRFFGPFHQLCDFSDGRSCL
jgi:hypothetical protein